MRLLDNSAALRAWLPRCAGHAGGFGYARLAPSAEISRELTTALIRGVTGPCLVPRAGGQRCGPALGRSLAYVPSTEQPPQGPVLHRRAIWSGRVSKKLVSSVRRRRRGQDVKHTSRSSPIGPILDGGDRLEPIRLAARKGGHRRARPPRRRRQADGGPKPSSRSTVSRAWRITLPMPFRSTKRNRLGLASCSSGGRAMRLNAREQVVEHHVEPEPGGIGTELLARQRLGCKLLEHTA